MAIDNFSWVVDGVLAGSGQIGNQKNEIALEKDLEWLIAEGIKAIVSLTSFPLGGTALNERGIDYVHLPVPDMCAPELDLVERFVNFVDYCRSGKYPVVVHCGAGLGRTGTAIACYFVHMGVSGTEALNRVRVMRPGSVETLEQEALIHRYHRQLLSRAGGSQETQNRVDSESPAR